MERAVGAERGKTLRAQGGASAKAQEPVSEPGRHVSRGIPMAQQVLEDRMVKDRDDGGDSGGWLLGDHTSHVEVTLREFRNHLEVTLTMSTVGNPRGQQALEVSVGGALTKITEVRVDMVAGKGQRGGGGHLCPSELAPWFPGLRGKVPSLGGHQREMTGDWQSGVRRGRRELETDDQCSPSLGVLVRFLFLGKNI